MSADSGSVTIEDLVSEEQFREVVRVQETIWGFSELDLLPVRFFVVASKIGGQVFGQEKIVNREPPRPGDAVEQDRGPEAEQNRQRESGRRAQLPSGIEDDDGGDEGKDGDGVVYDQRTEEGAFAPIDGQAADGAGGIDLKQGAWLRNRAPAAVGAMPPQAMLQEADSGDFHRGSPARRLANGNGGFGPGIGRRPGPRYRGADCRSALCW